MTMVYKLILLFTLISCNKVHDLHKQNGLHFIKEMYTEISNYADVRWDIGRKREVDISKGVRITSTLPSVSSESKKILRKKYGIDSWLIKVSRFRRGYAQSLGYFTVKLENMSRTTKDFTINLYYHAAAVSKRFRLFHCPAFNHRLSISSLRLNKRENISKKNLYVRLVERFPGKTSKLTFAPSVLSGGKALTGKYYIDLALYNSKKKQRYSDWSKGGNLISISQEFSKAVKSCLGVKEENHPLPSSKLPSIRDFEIKN